MIYGECEWRGHKVRVLISDLARSGCDLACEAGKLPAEGELSLWIGAIGPFAATAMRRDDAHLAAQFSQPLDERIIQHFARH